MNDLAYFDGVRCTARETLRAITTQRSTPVLVWASYLAVFRHPLRLRRTQEHASKLGSLVIEGCPRSRCAARGTAPAPSVNHGGMWLPEHAFGNVLVEMQQLMPSAS